uniref:Uncharacterized protein n=1 Tax=Glossina palpalis gambiensis TaxID=67801 RepID=A0A1B0BA50_9MUSC
MQYSINTKTLNKTPGGLHHTVSELGRITRLSMMCVNLFRLEKFFMTWNIYTALPMEK